MEGGAARMAGKPQTKILLTLGEDLKERMSNTLAWTMPHTGITSQQAFVRKAIADLCKQLEDQHNGGAPFAPTAKTADPQ